MPISNKKPLSPYSLRFRPEERAQLERDAAGMSRTDYIRSRLFDDSVPKRRTRNKFPVKDHQLLAQVLAELKRSHLSNNMNQLAKKANRGYPELNLDTQKWLCRNSWHVSQTDGVIGSKVKDKP